MKRAFALLLSVFPLPALALSCAPWGVESAFEAAASDDAAYIVAHGELTFDRSLLPDTVLGAQQEAPPSTDIPARLTGQMLTTSGFRAPFDTALTLRIICLGQWCAGAVEGPALVFLRRETGGFVLEQNACSVMLFSQPMPPDLKWVEQQMRAGQDR